MLSLREVASLTRGEAFGASAASSIVDFDAIRVDAIATDSRDIPAGALFVALSGDRFDGHAFIDRVASRGARAVLVERGRSGGVLPGVAVPDTRLALGDLAAGWRRRFDLPLITVAGSNGKTTTKAMIASILSAAFGEAGYCATRGNLNNDIGVPLTLFGLRSQHRVAVVEIGMNHPGETARLAAIAQPTVALVVNAQREHQEFMQTVAAVADEHALSIRALPDDGFAVFPADDPHAAVWRAAASDRRVVDFTCIAAGETARPGIALTATARLDVDATVLRLRVDDGETTVRLAVPGMHNARNATAAAAACVAAGIALDAIAAGLAAFRPVRGRSQRLVLDSGTVVVDDSYNANPDSMRAAIDLLATHPSPRLMVMGDMGEVGDDGPRFHAEVGAHARNVGIEALYALGAASRISVDAFGAGGLHFDAIEPLIDAVEHWVADGRAGAVVVKGSRFMRMERVVAALTDGGAAEVAARTGAAH